MHIVIDDQRTGDKAILCVERGATHAEVIQCHPDLLHQIEVIAKALGVDYLRMSLEENSVPPGGWERTNLVVIARALNGK